jgi:hypothetical protein
MDSSKKTTSYPDVTLSYADAFLAISGNFVSTINAFSNVKIERLEAKRQAQLMLRQLHDDARRASQTALAILSVASIDVSKGTAARIVNQSLTEASRESGRMKRSLV